MFSKRETELNKRYIYTERGYMHLNDVLSKINQKGQIFSLNPNFYNNKIYR